MDVHQLNPAQLSAIATGRAGPRTIAGLWRGQRSKRLLLLTLLMRSWPAPAADRDSALAVLAQAQARTPQVVGDLLDQPMVGAWAASTLRRLRRVPAPAADGPELGHFQAIAAVAALRTGLSARLRAVPAGGWLTLPSLGRLRVPVPAGQAVPILAADGRLRVDGAEVPVHAVPPEVDGDWQPLRVLVGTALPTVSATLEDVDPYRDAFQVPAADRLPPRAFQAWRARFDEAWSILARRLPAQAAQLAAGLRCIVPLTKPDAQVTRSGTVRDAVGALALDLPPSPVELVVALVHEFRHSILSAVLDITRLHADSREPLLRVPWRADPRPVGGALQGAYAFLGVAEAWRLLSTDPDAFPGARERSTGAREQSAEVIAALTRSGLLTAAGRTFIEGMAERVAALRAAPAPVPSDRSGRRR